MVTIIDVQSFLNSGTDPTTHSCENAAAGMK